MDDLLAARLQMAMSLAFHIIFAVVGIGIEEAYLELARRWAQGTAIFFAVGAVSGTVLSFELGLLWPQFMEWAGPIIGMPFSLEGFAFFTEAAASGIFVVIANGWMNTPSGFRLVDGRPICHLCSRGFCGRGCSRILAAARPAQSRPPPRAGNCL